MESVYIETTILSYLVANLARDIVIAGHQQTTQLWWSTRRAAFDFESKKQHIVLPRLV
jgi:hypothetical protein